MSAIWHLWLKPFRNGEQNCENIQYQNGQKLMIIDHYLFLISFLEKPARADDRLEMENLRLERADLRLGRADLKPERADLRPYRPDIRPGRPDEGNKWIDKQTS